MTTLKISDMIATPADAKRMVVPENNDELASLSPDDQQKIMNKIFADAQKQKEAEAPYRPKPLEITEEDRNNFCAAVCSGTDYSETFSRFGGKLTVKLRTKRYAEVVYISQQMQKDIVDAQNAGTPLTQAEYIFRVNCYNMLFQITELNGEVIGDVASGKELNESASLYDVYKNSKFYTMPDFTIQAVIFFMILFEEKVTKLSKEALFENFTKPETASS